MAKEIWTVSFEIDVEQYSSTWDHMDMVPHAALINTDECLVSIMPTDIEKHRFCCCFPMLSCKLLSREPVKVLA